MNSILQPVCISDSKYTVNKNIIWKLAIFEPDDNSFEFEISDVENQLAYDVKISLLEMSFDTKKDAINCKENIERFLTENPKISEIYLNTLNSSYSKVIFSLSCGWSQTWI